MKLTSPAVLYFLAMIFTAAVVSAVLVPRVGPLLGVFGALAVVLLGSFAAGRFSPELTATNDKLEALMRLVEADEGGQQLRWRYYARRADTPHQMTLFTSINELALFLLRHRCTVGKVWVVVEDFFDEDPVIDGALPAAIEHFKATAEGSNTTDEVGKARSLGGGTWIFTERRGASEAAGGEPTHGVFASNPGCGAGICGHETHALINPLGSKEDPSALTQVLPDKARAVANLGPGALGLPPRLMLVGLAPLERADAMRTMRAID